MENLQMNSITFRNGWGHQTPKAACKRRLLQISINTDNKAAINIYQSKNITSCDGKHFFVQRQIVGPNKATRITTKHPKHTIFTRELVIKLKTEPYNTNITLVSWNKEKETLLFWTRMQTTWWRSCKKNYFWGGTQREKPKGGQKTTLLSTIKKDPKELGIMTIQEGMCKAQNKKKWNNLAVACCRYDGEA